MNFKEVLNEYLKELNCSSKKLSNESGLSESVISRYRSGERTPVKNSEQLNKLTKAQYDKLLEQNRISETELYFITDDNGKYILQGEVYTKEEAVKELNKEKITGFEDGLIFIIDYVINELNKNVSKVLLII